MARHAGTSRASLGHVARIAADDEGPPHKALYRSAARRTTSARNRRASGWAFAHVRIRAGGAAHGILLFAFQYRCSSIGGRVGATWNRESTWSAGHARGPRRLAGRNGVA